jgi:hypothetical protein
MLPAIVLVELLADYQQTRPRLVTAIPNSFVFGSKATLEIALMEPYCFCERLRSV